MSDKLPVFFEKGDLKLETINRLECEHRDVLEDNSLDPCDNDADYAVTTADYGEPTRSRYCSYHVWDAVSGWMERNDEHD